MPETDTKQDAAQNAELRADNYDLTTGNPNTAIAAPHLPYKPRNPQAYKPNIGLIACGGITEAHCKAYVKAGYNVVALCDLIEERARKRQGQFFPGCVRDNRLPRHFETRRHCGCGHCHPPERAFSSD